MINNTNFIQAYTWGWGPHRQPPDHSLHQEEADVHEGEQEEGGGRGHHPQEGSCHHPRAQEQGGPHQVP